MWENSLKTKAGIYVGPGDVDLHVRRVNSTSMRLICGAFEYVVLNVGGAGLSVGSFRLLRWASAQLRESPSKEAD